MKRGFLIAGLLMAASFLMVPGASLYFEVGNGTRCTSCHEMQPLFDTWHTSSHRNIACGKCHGDALTLDAAFHMNNAHRAWSHVQAFDIFGWLPVWRRSICRHHPGRWCRWCRGCSWVLRAWISPPAPPAASSRDIRLEGRVPALSR